MKLFCEMPEDELEKVDLVEFTKLKIGDRVTHKNAGQHGGSGTTISAQRGTIIGHDNQGLYHWGGLCVTVRVLWDDGTETCIGYSLARKAV
jgi:hypothetical protein